MKIGGLGNLNLVTIGVLIVYIVYINLSSNLKWNDSVLKILVNLSNNWVFRIIFLGFVGAVALDLIPGGIGLAIILTIAFLNTTLLGSKGLSENFSVPVAQCTSCSL